MKKSVELKQNAPTAQKRAPLFGKSILTLADMDAKEIALVLETAAKMKTLIRADCKKHSILRGKSIATLFYEPSTRTRVSFELAGKYLGADVANIAVNTSSVTKGESFRDTLLTLEAMGVDAIVIRAAAEGAADYASRVVRPVIFNAGDGARAHPTQGLLDIFTIQERKGRLAGLKVAIIGDILHSRVARSDIDGMRAMGIEVHLSGPRTLMPRFLTEEKNLFVHERIEDALANADVIQVLRIQLERMKGGLFPSTGEYARLFALDESRLRLAKPDALVLHPGPINRGWEITGAVAYGAKSAIQEEVQNGVAVRMALFALCLTDGEHE